MFDNTITVTDGVTPITLAKVKTGNLTSQYYLNDSGTNRRLTLGIDHTVPNSGIGESHLVRLDISHYSDEGKLLRVSSAWTVIKTNSGIQDDAASEEAAKYLNSLIGDEAFMSRVIDRES